MTSATGSDISSSLYDVLGYDHTSNKIKIGALAENTHPQIRSKIEDMLTTDRGLTPSQARSVVDATWKDTPEDLQVKSTGPLRDLFTMLQKSGIKIAICTSDSREGTEAFLDLEDLRDLVDIIVCGDDSVSKPKPDPHNAHYICKELGVSESETIMVGDTPADTLMGQQAGLGLTVGVLTGVGGKNDLTDADVIVDDVRECIEMVIPRDEKSWESRVHQVTSRGISKIVAGAWFNSKVGGNFNSGSNHRAMSTGTTTPFVNQAFFQGFKSK